MDRKCIISVAKGGKYGLDGKRMLDSFLCHNITWDARTYFDGELEGLLPKDVSGWNDFSKAEIGRWYAINDALKDYDTVVYADGDIRWYGNYQEDRNHGIVLFPHYVTDFAKRNAKHNLLKDGICNLGIIEMHRHVQNGELFDFVIGEVLHKPDAFRHGENLWLQNLASAIPECGFDASYNTNPGYDVACWNLRKGDREVCFSRDGIVVRCGGMEYPLVSFHFSSKSLGYLDFCGDAAVWLKRNYFSESR